MNEGVCGLEVKGITGPTVMQYLSEADRRHRVTPRLTSQWVGCVFFLLFLGVLALLCTKLLSHSLFLANCSSMAHLQMTHQMSGSLGKVLGGVLK